MRNTLADLNNHLFEQLERLNEPDLHNEELDLEIKRSEAVSNLARTIIENGKLSLQAKKHLDEYGQGESVDMPLLGIKPQRDS